MHPIGHDAALAGLRWLASDTDARRAIARAAISQSEQRNATETETDALAAALGEHLHALLARLQSDRFLLIARDKDGLLRFDAIGLAYLEQVGTQGKITAEHLRSDAQARWQEYARVPEADESAVWEWWCAEGSAAPFTVILARVVWVDLIRPASSPPQVAPQPPSSAIPPVLAAPRPMNPVTSAVVLRRIMEAFFIGNLTMKQAGSEVRLFGARGNMVATASPDLDVERLARATRTLLGHRLFRHLVHSGVHAGIAGQFAKTHDHRVLKIAGGLTGLAECLGISGSKTATELRSVLDAFALLRLRLPHGETDSLISWAPTPEKPGERALLGVELHDALLPGYVTGLPKTTRAQREARRLVPIPGNLPPLVGHRRTHASQALLQLLILEEMSARAEELFRNEVVHISWARWLEMAHEAGLSNEQLVAVFEFWAYGPTPFVRREPIDGETYTLGDSYASELQVLRQGGEKAAKGRARQALQAKHRA